MTQPIVHASSADRFEGGFADPVFKAQTVFSKVLDAMSRPGEVVDLAGCCAPPQPLSVAQGGVLLTLCDSDTPVYLGTAAETAGEWLAFHTGARSSDLGRASFAVLPAFDRTCLEHVPLGTLSYPDRSATLLVEVESLGSGSAFRLEGPGIDGHRMIEIKDLPGDFIEGRAANQALFPCGIDLVLTAGSLLCALPRSTRVSEG